MKFCLSGGRQKARPFKGHASVYVRLLISLDVRLRVSIREIGNVRHLQYSYVERVIFGITCTSLTLASSAIVSFFVKLGIESFLRTLGY